MKTRVAKAILKNILWSAILAGVSCLLVYVVFAERNLENYSFIASVAFIAGLIAFALYWEIQIKGARPIVNIALSAIIWSFALAIYGGIGVAVISSGTAICLSGSSACRDVFETWWVITIGSVPVSFVAGLITFTLYGLIERLRVDQKQQDASHQSSSPSVVNEYPTNNVMKISKKRRIALIGSSVLLLGMIPVLVILDPVGFRSNATEDNDIVKECGTLALPLTLKLVDPFIAIPADWEEGWMYSHGEYWEVHDANNQVLAREQRYYYAGREGDITIFSWWERGCFDEEIRRVLRSL